MASSTHWIASQSAMGILERGGNAADAAVAAGLVLHVVEPHLCGPGGEVPIMVWDETRRRSRVIDGQGWAPALADRETFRSLGLDLVPGTGLLGAAVPGAVPAWLTLLAEYGAMGIDEVFEPAIRYASSGCPAPTRLVQALHAVRELFEVHWPSSAATWIPGGRIPRPGELFRLPALAATYRRLVSEACDSSESRVGRIEEAISIWQTGFVARSIDEFSRSTVVYDSSGGRHGGLLRYDDIAEWTVTQHEPVSVDFGRYRVEKGDFGGPGPMMLQQLSVLAHADLSSHDPTGAQFVHRIAEAAKLAFADRLGWYGRSTHADADAQAALLSDAYGRSRWELIRNRRASDQLEPGSPTGRDPQIADLDASRRTLAEADVRFGVGEPTFADLVETATAEIDASEINDVFVGDTCHVDVIDSAGNMVAATPSGGWLSSSPTIPDLGFALGTRLQATWLQDGLAASLEPRVSPLHTLTTSLAFHDDEPYMVFGTPGGDQQDQWATSFFLRHVVHGLDLQEAIDAPSWHVTHYPSSFWPRATSTGELTVESRFDDEVVAELEGLGHEVTVGGPWSEGRLSAASRQRGADGTFTFRAAANPRGMQGYAVGR